MSKRILIITELGDVHAYAVARALDYYGADVTLWHTGDFPTFAGETIQFEEGERSIRVRNPAFVLDNFSFDTVWQRRPSYVLDESRLHPADRRFADSECCLFRRSILNLVSPGAFWVNPSDAAVRAERKPLQHQVAHEVGFLTPATIYTNDPEEIRAFLKRRGGLVAYKPLRGTSWNDGETLWGSYTSLITESTLVEDDLLRVTPGIYQEVIDKDYELRITVLGDHVLGAKIYSQETQAGRLDWRRSYDDLRIEACEVPSEIADLCRRTLRRLNLVFGCFDVAVTPQGEHIFLEVNQMGQFLFIERYAGVPLLDAFSAFLIQARPDFRWSATGVNCRYSDVVHELHEMTAKLSCCHVASPDRAVCESIGQYSLNPSKA
jgi:glutathione synthase/RimK-type ligase-like ATP-grasp enzyme